MATLERIRQRSGLLLGVIGMAMLAFILTDLLGSGNSILSNDGNVIGEVDGVEISATEFNSKIEERLAQLQSQNPQQAAGISRTVVANQIWTEYQEEILLSSKYLEMGFSVTDEELFEEITGNPQIKSQFADPNTGQFSKSGLQDYVRQIRESAASDERAASAYNQWLAFEDGTREQALREKFLYAVRKGLYMPASLAKADYARRNEFTSLQYFGLEFSSIIDSTIEVSEKEMAAYYKSNKTDFVSNNSRDLAFVSFGVAASDKDRSMLQNELNGYLKEEIITTRGKVDTLPSFYTSEDDSTYAVGRSDRPVNSAFKTKEQFAAPLDSILFAAEEGYIHGPYEQNGTFMLSKVAKITSMPDSVNARHILLSYQGAGNGQSQSTRAPQDAKNLADSLFAVIEADSSQFGALAKTYSDDPESGAKGGPLGWFGPGAMVPQFNDYCFYNKAGDIGLVISTFGFHIIHIKQQEGANKAIMLIDIIREIEASDETRDSIYDLASDFASKANDTSDFASVAAGMGYSPRPLTNIEPMQENLSGIGLNRELVRWVHNEETTAGAIQLFNQENNSFIVVQVTEIRPEEFLPLVLVEEQVKIAVRKEKKATLLMEQLTANWNENNDINALAAAVSKEVKNQSVNFGTANLTGYGSEPAVIGTASGLEAGKMSSPIVGERGVYVVFITSRNNAEDLENYESEQIRIETAMSNLAPTQVLESMKKDAEVEDKRKMFF